MRTEIAETIAHSLVKGALDVFEAMLSMPFSYVLSTPVDASARTYADFLSRFDVAMRATMPSGGGLALLMTRADAAKIVGLISGAEQTELAEQDLATLREVAEPCLGSGMTNLLERNGKNVEQPQQVAATIVSPEDAGPLADSFAGPSTAVSFTFSAGDAFNESAAVIAFSEQFARILPEASHHELNELAQELAANPELSESEMSDILSGFSPEESSEPLTAAAPPAPVRSNVHMPANLEMILDIRLVATARLGRVEMPISEVLALGPGSIIDVGHLVDEPVELLVNNRLIARGDVVVVDEKFGLRITEIVSPKERIESMH